MYYFHNLLSDYPLLSALQGVFMLAMIFDAYRRGAEQWWFYVIFFVPVLGAWAYFVAVLLPQIDWRSPFWERKTPIEELSFRAQATPTFANSFALGQRLTEVGRYDEAIAPLQDALKREPTHSPAAFHLARCFYETHRSADAVPLVQRIIEKDPRWEDYSAWPLLVMIQEDLGHDDAALESARHLVKLSPRIGHKVILAQQLVHHEENDEARLLLETALQEQQYVNGPVRRLNKRWVKEARRLLQQLSA